MPEPNSNLYKLAEEAIRLSSVISSSSLDVISASNASAWTVGRDASEAQVERFTSACEDLCTIIETSGGPFLLGSHPGVADIMSWPFVHRALCCMKKFSSHDAMAEFEESGLCGHASAWIKAMQSCSSVNIALPKDDLLLEALKSSGRLDWFDYQTVGVNELHPHLRDASL